MADGALARRGCVRLAALQCFGPGSGQRSHRSPEAPQSQPPTPDDDPLTTMFHHV